MIKKLFFFSMIVLFLFSLGCFIAPSVFNLINEYNNDSKINEYNQNVKAFSDDDINSKLLEAQEYNQVVATDYFNKNDDYSNILNGYKDILSFDSNGLIGYIEIPSINVKLPIYHGESEEVLKKGAAHVEQTSFPIGGNNTHACLSAHSGYPTQKFFDDIDELSSGDLIYIYILNQKYCYKVYGRQVVEPYEVKKLRVESDKDILTLITCYPYGINSHRLLVNAEQTDYIDNSKNNEKNAVDITPLQKNSDMLFICSVLASAAILAVASVILFRRKKRKKGDK